QAIEKYAIVYYDKDYHSAEKEDKTTSLLDTLSDGGEQQIEQQIQQEEIKIKVNKYFSRLEFHEELIIRLFFGIEPKEPDLEDQIIRLATEEKVKELKKIKKRKIPSDEAGKVYPLLEKYRKFLAVSRQKEEVIQEFMQLEFWEYFHEFPEFSLKPESSRRGGTKKTKLTEAKQTTEQEK
ncbi:3307_t:CDS:2, partial [Racocetra persica]